MTRLTATPVRLRRRTVVQTGLGHFRPTFDEVIVEVETDEGTVGLGEAPARPTIYGDSVGLLLQSIRDVVGPAVLGTPLDRGDELRRRLQSIADNHVAKGAVENAFFDAVGKAGGFGWLGALGGDGATTLAPPWLVGQGSVTEVMEEVRSAHERDGFTAFKLKVGADWRVEARAVAAVREAFDSQLVLYIDANRAFSPNDALQFARATVDFDLAFFEEPCAAGAIDVRRAIQEYIPVMNDESSITIGEAVAALDRGAANALNLKPARFGFFGSLWLSRLVELRELGALAGSQMETSVGSAVSLVLAACSATLAMWPAEGGLGCVMLDGDVVVSPVRLTDGRVAAPSGPGFGMELDPDGLARLSIADEVGTVVLQ